MKYQTFQKVKDKTCWVKNLPNGCLHKASSYTHIPEVFIPDINYDSKKDEWVSAPLSPSVDGIGSLSWSQFEDMLERVVSQIPR